MHTLYSVQCAYLCQLFEFWGLHALCMYMYIVQCNTSPTHACTHSAHTLIQHTHSYNSHTHTHTHTHTHSHSYTYSHPHMHTQTVQDSLLFSAIGNGSGTLKEESRHVFLFDHLILVTHTANQDGFFVYLMGIKVRGPHYRRGAV